jgi:Ulp1 family protease
VEIQVSPTSHFKIPAQTDGCSCGLFALAFADCLGRGFKLEELSKLFVQKDMGDIRSYVLSTLLCCKMKG